MKVSVKKFNLLDSVRQLTRDKWALGATVFSGKMIGLGLVVLAIFTLPGFFGSAAHAAVAAKADTSALEKSILTADTTMMNSIDTVWTLVAAFLVFAMQAGFVMLEIGFARKRETVNILMECIFDTCLCGILSFPRLLVTRLCLAAVTDLSATTGSSCKTHPICIPARAFR